MVERVPEAPWSNGYRTGPGTSGTGGALYQAQSPPGRILEVEGWYRACRGASALSHKCATGSRWNGRDGVEDGPDAQKTA